MSTIGDILKKKGTEVAIAPPDLTVLDAAKTMNQQQIGALCVVEKGALIGIFTERDILNRMVGTGRDVITTKLRDVMTAPVITCGSQGRTEDCAAVMSHKHIRHLPVVDDGKLVGIVSTGDLLALQMAEKQNFIEDLYNYLHGRT